MGEIERRMTTRLIAGEGAHFRSVCRNDTRLLCCFTCAVAIEKQTCRFDSIHSRSEKVTLQILTATVALNNTVNKYEPYGITQCHAISTFRDEIYDSNHTNFVSFPFRPQSSLSRGSVTHAAAR